MLLPRRSFIIGAGAALVASTARAFNLGLVGRPELITMLSQLESVEEGSGPCIQAIVSPVCGHSLAVFDAAESLLARSLWRWIPYAGPTPGGEAAVSRILANRNRVTLRRELSRAPGASPSAPSDARVRRQDSILDIKVGRYLWEATNSAFATPTIVFRDRAGLTRVVRGDPRPEDVARIVDEAT